MTYPGTVVCPHFSSDFSYQEHARRGRVAEAAETAVAVALIA